MQLALAYPDQEVLIVAQLFCTTFYSTEFPGKGARYLSQSPPRQQHSLCLCGPAASVMCPITHLRPREISFPLVLLIGHSVDLDEPPCYAVLWSTDAKLSESSLLVPVPSFLSGPALHSGTWVSGG